MTQAVATDHAELHEQIIDGVAALENADPLDLPPLYDAVDVDALDALFATTLGGTTRTGRIEFTYAGHEITVEYDEDSTVTID